MRPFVVEKLGPAYLVSSLKKNGYEVDWLRTDEDNLIGKIKDYRADVLAVSMCTGEHRFYLDLIRKVKKEYSNCLSVFGGSHPT